MKEALLYKKLKDKQVQCRNCAHFCIIKAGERGTCNVRENTDGKLYALNYGKVIATNIDPIEKKPFFHFLPGSYSLSIATVGCNFSCLNCQNYDISQGFKKLNKIPGETIKPKEIVNIALENNLPSISYTYTEPTIFSEYALDIMKIAKKEGLKNTWVTNGFWSEELFKRVSPLMDAANVDLKGFSDKFYIQNCGAKLKPVLDNLVQLRKEKIWLEITTLVIPGLSDDEKMFKDIAKFIKGKLGSEVPWHLSQFSGTISWKLQHLPDTDLKTLEKAYEIAKKTGLEYVYIGNVFGHPSEDTFCPKCNTLSIDRTGYVVQRFDRDGRCPECGKDLNIILE